MINIAQLDAGDPVHIGADPDPPLLVGDSLEAQFQIAEAFDTTTGAAVNPADFTADGGWIGSLEIESSPFSTAAVGGFGADGVYTITIDAADIVAGDVGAHRYNVIVTNGTRQRTIQKGTIVVDPRFAA
jgi:hypothetical protein